MVQLGDKVDYKNNPIATIHANDEVRAERMANRLRASLTISNKTVDETAVIADIIK